ncbi:MAG: TonB-dependent receptor [Porticoccaceae bacterium]|nr:TonB-dependent receptor [Porticoccaceae bacterium]
MARVSIGAETETVSQKLDIPPSRAEDAIKQLARAFRRPVLFQAKDVARVTVNPVNGQFTLLHALEAMLESTELQGGLTERGVITISRRTKIKASVEEQSVKKSEFFLKTLLSTVVAGFTSAQAEDAKSSSESLEEVVVTGSRIVRPDINQPTPVTSLSQEAISLSGAINIADVVNELPNFAVGVGRSNNNFSFTRAGLNTLNLRDLGTQRTLVLVNGRRHVSSVQGSGEVDISTIPSALVERVDVITGGASAVYGADAVAGVVNFILKDDFEGFDMEVQTGISEEGDADELSAAFTMGGNFSDGRGNAVVHFSYANREPVLRGDRDFSNFRTLFRTPASLGINNSQFSQIAVSDTRTVENHGSAVLLIPGANQRVLTFNQDLSVRDQVLGPSGLIGTSTVDGGEAPALSQTGRLFQLTTPLDRYLLTGKVHYELTPDHRFFVDGKFARTEASSVFDATFELPGFTNTLSVDNPFVRDDLRAILDGAGITSFGVRRRNVELGPRRQENTRDLFRIAMGFKGTLFDDYDYNLYYQFGKVEFANAKLNDRFEARWAQALDAVRDPTTGEIVCRDRSNGCVPLNILGPTGTISPEALAFVHIPHAVGITDIQQRVLSADISGAVPFWDLPAGQMRFAAGVEYRDEFSDDQPSTVQQQAQGFFNSRVRPTRGEYDVLEVFAEVLVPLISDAPWTEELSLEAAVRNADYSGSGSATSYKLGLSWSPVEDIKFRSPYARAVRAPNIGELFAQGSDSFLLVNDPCDMDFVNAGSSNRRANCIAQGVADPDSFVSDARSTSIRSTSPGNANLQVETADTITFGVVWQPSFLPDLSINVDYWDIELSDAINSFPVQTILDNCVDLASSSNPFCALVSRNSGGNISLVTAQNINVSRFDVSGIDLGIDYVHAIGEGTLRLNTDVAYLSQRDFVVAPGTVSGNSVDENAGELGRPEWRARADLTYNLDKLTVNWTQRYVGEQEVNVQEPQNARNPRTISDRWYTDVQGQYQLNESLSLRLGINNLFDVDPPFFPGAFEGIGNAALFDNIGRYLYAGFKYSI